MKLIRKLNPFNPILPAFCLLIAFAWVGYDSFFREKYSEEEKIYFEDAIGEVENLFSMYRNDAYNMIGNMSWDFEYEYCLRGSYMKIGRGGKKLDSLIDVLIEKNFYDIDFSKELPIRSVFESYIEEAKKLDILLVEKYENFELENGLSNKEVNAIYFSHDEAQGYYHLARFKMQLAKMYHDDIELLIKHRIENVKRENK
jgi:predicted nucleotidyltransferase